MKVPCGYPKTLEKIIDRHVNINLIPDIYVLSYQNICLEMTGFLMSNSKHNDKILEIGGRSSPLSLNEKITLTSIETRKRYKHNTSPGSAVDDLEEKIKLHDVVIIHADYIAECGYKNSIIKNINKLISNNQKFFLVKYNWHNDTEKTIEIIEDGFFLNWGEYKKWFDINRSHMHLGFESHKFDNFTIYDFSYFYPLGINIT